MRCNFLNPFLFCSTLFFLSNWCFTPLILLILPPGSCPDFPQDVFFSLIFNQVSLSLGFFYHHWFSKWNSDGGEHGITMNHPLRSLNVWLSLFADEVTGFDRDWPSKWNHFLPPSLRLNLLYPPAFDNKLFTNSHFIPTFVTLLFTWHKIQLDACRE